MDYKTKQRLAAGTLTALLAAANIALFSVLTRLGHESPGDNTLGVAYLLLGLIIMLSFLLVAVSYMTIKKNSTLIKELGVLETEKQALLEYEQKKKEAEKEERKTVNYKAIAGEYLGKILPGVEMTPGQMAEKSLANLSQELQGVQGIFYTKAEKGRYKPTGTFAYVSEEAPKTIEAGSGIGGQAVKDNQIVRISEMPDTYLTIVSGLGQSKARELLFIPLSYKDECVALIELALFKQTDEETINMLDEFRKLFGRTYVKALKEKELS